MLDDSPTVARAEGGCRSWPWCDKPAVTGRRFCARHQAALDRVGRSISPKKFNTTIAETRSLTNVKVSYLPATEPAKPAARQRVKRAEFASRILEALKDSALSSARLAAAVGSAPGDNTYARARRELEAGGRVTVERVGRARVYSLATG
jgi:hypothetical protein